MPDAAADTTTAPETTEPAPYVFPFETPADLAGASEEELRAAHGQIRAHAADLAGLSPAQITDETLAGLAACRDTAKAIAAELSGRRERSSAAVALAGEIDDLPEDDDVDLDDGNPAGDDADPDGDAAVSAAPPAAEPATAAATVRPRVRDVANRTRAPQLPPQRRTAYAQLRASADVPGFASGATLASMDDVVRAVSARLDHYPLDRASRARWPKDKLRPVTAYDADEPGRSLTLRNFTRHSAVEMRREYPEDLRVDGKDGYEVAQHAARERRLPGGSLASSMAAQIKAGVGLTAASGWCAPSETMYELLELESTDGMLALPEIDGGRGGWNIPVNGGPDFASIYDQLGNAGVTHLTEQQVIDGATKVAIDIGCPDFEEVRLGVDYISLTGGLLQRRAYPETVGRFTRAAVTGLAHKINMGVIAAIVAGSGAAVTIPQDASGDDAASALLAAVELAIIDAKYRHRMSFNGTMEVVLPWWVLAPIRAALSRRTGTAGDGTLGVTDAQILEWFSLRKAVPRFVYDWQDAMSGLATGPGGATALTRLPLTTEMLVYPAGTWVKAVQPVINIDTLFDSTLLAANQFSALFVEDGWAVLKMAPISRRYVVNVDPSGVVGCCDPVGS